MPEPNTHIAAGLGLSWMGAKLIGLDTDFLIVGMVGSLLAAARSTPEPYTYAGHYLVGKGRQTLKVVSNLCAVSFFSATATSIGLVFFPMMEPASIPVAGMVGFFGQPIIKSILEFVSRAWRAGLNRIGGSGSDADL